MDKKKCTLLVVQRSKLASEESNYPDTEQVIGIPTVIDLPLADDITIKNLQMTLLDAEDAEVFDTEEELESFRDAVHLVVKFMLNDDNFESWLFELEKIRLDIDQQKKKDGKIMDFEIGNLTREEILNVLRENTVNLSFTKSKGWSYT